MEMNMESAELDREAVLAACEQLIGVMLAGIRHEVRMAGGDKMEGARRFYRRIGIADDDAELLIREVEVEIAAGTSAT